MRSGASWRRSRGGAGITSTSQGLRGRSLMTFLAPAASTDARSRLSSGPAASTHAFRLFLQRNEMQTALCFLAAAPPARAWILARHHRAGARHAANAGIVPIVERIVGHVMLAHVRLYVVERPAHERVDLDEGEAAVPGGDRRAGALGWLVAPDRCNPGVVSRQRRAQGQHLSLLAAAIGVAAPELGPLV